MHAGAYGDRLGGVAAVGLQDLHAVGPHRERQAGAAEGVVGAGGIERELIQVGRLDGVVGVRPAEMVVKADADERATGEGDAIGIQRRRARVADHKVHLEPLINAEAAGRLVVAPRKMRIAHQDGVAAGRQLRPDSPAVGARRVHVAGGGVGRGQATGLPGIDQQAGGRARDAAEDVVLGGDEGEPDRQLLIGGDVGWHQREDRLEHGADRVGMLLRILVGAGAEGGQQLALLGAALGDPLCSACGDAIGAHVGVADHVGIVCTGAEILGHAATRQSDVVQDGLGVRFHLRVSQAALHRHHVRPVNVRYAIGVPADDGTAGGLCPGGGGQHQRGSCGQG